MTPSPVMRLVAVAAFVFAAEASVAATPEEPPARAAVTVEPSGVSVKAQAVPLREVLLEIARVAGVAVYIEDTVDRAVTTAPTTVTLDHVSLDDALSRVLRGSNFVLEYSGGRVDVVRLFGADRGTFTRLDAGGERGDRPRGDPAEPDAATLASVALSAPDPDDRASALTDLAALGDDPRVRDVAVAVLDRERDDDVLEVLLGILGDQSSLPVDALLRFVARDTRAALRIQALELLAEHARDDPRLRPALTTLATDRDESVRETAQSMLEDLTD